MNIEALKEAMQYYLRRQRKKIMTDKESMLVDIDAMNRCANLINKQLGNVKSFCQRTERGGFGRYCTESVLPNQLGNQALANYYMGLCTANPKGFEQALQDIAEHHEGIAIETNRTIAIQDPNNNKAVTYPSEACKISRGTSAGKYTLYCATRRGVGTPTDERYYSDLGEFQNNNNVTNTDLKCLGDLPTFSRSFVKAECRIQK